MTLSSNIGTYGNVHALWLEGNRLTDLPPEIINLEWLKTLSLDDNRLTAVPSEIWSFPRLETLTLSANQLTALPPEIGQLTNLRTLMLSANQLTALPPEIGQLTNLETLWLEENRLTEIPWQLAGPLSRGLRLRLRGNPLNEPIPELAERGIEALANYLRSLKDSVAQYDAKLLLVGEGNVGKTSLVAALCNDPFIEGRPTTHGIEIRDLVMRHPEHDLDMTIRTWDFGGQEVYRITHQFFFSTRALYLVVWKPREGQEQDQVEGWLRRIRLRVGADARALVVATHCEECKPELNSPHLGQAFPRLFDGQYEVDNRTGSGIAELRRKIAERVARLPQVGQLISTRWIAARDEILACANDSPEISYERFIEICQLNDVRGEEVATLVELMHDLGQIVYYGEDEGLRDFVVLNPEWLTKAISYVLEDVPTRESNGVLDHSRLKEIWQDRPDGAAYPRRYHPYFLRLMERFDISYRLEDDQYRSLIAQLVPHSRPDLPWDGGMPPQDGTRSLGLICKLSEPVPGLIAWLTVRHHRASIGKHWRSGVFLRYPIAAYASEALMELQTTKQLGVEVRAPSPELFFNVLRDSIEDLITRRWPGLNYQLFVPCPKRNADGRRCSGQFPLEGLVKYRERGGKNAPCWECHIDYQITELLTGFPEPTMPLKPELEQLRVQVARVAGGVNRLEALAAESAYSIRRVLRAVSSEISDCPRLFTLIRRAPSGIDRLRIDEEHYRLTLWCEQPGRWHPWPSASYSIDVPKDWINGISPYVGLVFKALQVVVPLAASVAGIILTDEQLKYAQSDLELMTDLVAEFPEHMFEKQRAGTIRESAGPLSPAEGRALRAIRVLLLEHDHFRAFGDMRRIQAVSGEFLWVCPSHYVDYDPGLPHIP